LSQLLTDTLPDIKYRNTSTQEIEKIINSLKTKNSYGYEEISTKLLKISSPLIISAIKYYQQDSLKYSEIKPLHKKGDKKIQLTTDPYHFYLHFRRAFKRLYI
jgi:hypothetical protein